MLHALGEDKLSDVVSQLLPLASHPKPAPREGLLWLFAFLPSVLGERFSGLIDVSLPVVLKVHLGSIYCHALLSKHMCDSQGLSDDAELVRDVAMRSGQAIVNQHARTHSDVLIPPLQNGVYHCT